MNQWHLAVINDTSIIDEPIFARLDLSQTRGGARRPDFTEPWIWRRYIALVINNEGNIEFHDVTFSDTSNPNKPIIYFDDDGHTNDRNNEVKLLIIGKPIVRDNMVLPPPTIVDKFQDIRHLFACVRF